MKKRGAKPLFFCPIFREIVVRALYLRLSRRLGYARHIDSKYKIANGVYEMTKTLFFDFDGTIADSERGIVDGIKYMIKDMGLTPLAPNQYRDWIGPSLSYSMHKYFPGVDVKKGIASYQEYYTDKGIFELSLYDGIVDTLQNLRAQDYKIAVASSKPEVMIERIVDHLKLRSLFDGAYGASADERTRVSKTDVLRYAMQNMDAEQGSSIMIGDRFTDIEGGKNNDVKTLGVTYGFGDAHELKKAGADIIVDAPVAIDAAAAKLF